MADKVIDLTGKLGMAGETRVRVGKVTLTVNDSAPNILQVMALMGEDATPELITRMGHLLFVEGDAYNELLSTLSLDGMQTLVRAAVEAVTGGEGEGEAGTPATT